jgi:tetratricopeptide (TPR) repeat protein
VCAFGEPGIGKSSLAMSVAARPDVRQHFSDGMWWVDAAGMDLRAMCETVASALGTTEVAQAESDDDRLGALRTVIGEREPLVVLDNCEDPDASARFAEKAHRATLVTSQHRPRGPHPVELGRMTDEECLQILRRNARRTLRPDEEDAASEIVSLMAGHPFAVALAGSQIEDASAQDVLRALKGSPWTVLTDRARRKRAVKRTLDEAYKRLSPDDRALFAKLAVFGGPSFDLAAVQAVEHSANPARMDQLVRRSLVREEEGRYALHPLVRRYARDRLGGKREPYLKMAEHYLGLAEALGGDPSNFRRLDPEVGNALAAMDWCLEVGEWESGARISAALGQYLYHRGLWGEGRRRLEQGRAAAEISRDRSLLAMCSHNLGLAAQQQGDYGEARRLYQESLEIKEELGDRSGIARSKHQLGNVAYLTGDYPEARRLYQGSLTIAQELGDRSGIAVTKHQLGMLAQEQGDYSEARRLYQESLAIFEELRDRPRIAATKHQLGNIAYLTGDYPEARRLYQESLDIEEELGNRLGIAQSKHQLGMLAQERGDYPEAGRLYRESLAIKEELGDRSGIARTKHQLGMLAQERGDHPEARRLYQESLSTREELGDRLGIAQSKGALGDLAKEQGDIPAARALYQEALAIFESLGSPYAKTARRDLERVATKKPKGKSKKKRRPPAP